MSISALLKGREEGKAVERKDKRVRLSRGGRSENSL
jgi:hypothetical protein